MALETILKNISFFLELLQSARSSNDLDWSTCSFQNAFHWAEYCEKIYFQSRGKPYEIELNDEIKKLNHLPWTLGDLFIDLDLLKDSVGLLALALIQRENTSHNTSKLKFVQERVEQNEFLRNKFEDVSTMNDMLKEISKKFESTKDPCNPMKDSQNNFIGMSTSQKLQIETAATLLIDYLQQIFSVSLYDSTIQKVFLRDKLHQLTKSETGLTILVEAYLILFNTRERTSKNVLEFLEHFMESLVRKSNANFWTSLPKYFVLGLCSTNEEFLKKLFDILDGMSKDLVIHYNEEIFDTSTGRLSLFDWRYEANSKEKPSTITTSYEWLKSWVTLFLKKSDREDVSTRAGDMVSSLAKRSEVNVWRTLCQDLHRIDLI